MKSIRPLPKNYYLTFRIDEHMGTYNTYSDMELAAFLKQGDEAAYTEIYLRYHAALYLHVFNKLRLREESRDIVHDLFANLWKRHQTIELTGKLSAYLYVSARYKIFDFIAHRETASGYVNSLKDFLDREDYIADHLIREKQLQNQIDKEIASLPPKMRQIFELSRKNHLTHRQIADELGLSEQTVKKQVNNSLKILRGRLGLAIFIAFVF